MHAESLYREPSRDLSEAEHVDWLRLLRSENVGPVTFFAFLRRYGSAAESLSALPTLARKGGRASLRIAPREEAERELDATRKAGARLIAHGERDYPSGLAAIYDTPPLLSMRGRTDIAADPSRVVAMVGARNASGVGARFARTLAAELGSQGLVVASGLARGIDAAAHEGALASGTVAVLAGGIDQPYPAENKALYDAIVDQGLIIAEQPVGTEPHARHFPRRNRLISGLSMGVVVVEVALRSGSLITVRMALEQGREVLAVPGSPLDPRCRGSNNLLREGATLVENAGRRGPRAQRPAYFAGAGRRLRRGRSLCKRSGIGAGTRSNRGALEPHATRGG